MGGRGAASGRNGKSSVGNSYGGSEIKEAYDKMKTAESNGTKRRALNELFDNYQNKIKSSSYDWEKIGGKEVLARISGKNVFVLNLKTGKEEQVK